MGHCVMLLAVAGLDEDEIKQRTQKLASGDWSAFPPAERAAFEFGYKLTRTPHTVASSDIDALIATFGPDRAVDVIWYASWCNYMTRVADAIQFPLERDNVFASPPGQGSATDKKGR
jgi:alkylhydroperoxidase family enzyme